MNFKNKYLKIKNDEEFNLIILILHSHNIPINSIKENYGRRLSSEYSFIYRFRHAFSYYNGKESTLIEASLTEYLLEDFIKNF